MAKFSIILIAAPLAAIGAIAPAAASAAGEEKQSVTVRYGDLNLASESGRDRLTGRVKVAIRQVCGSNSRRTIAERADTRRCEVEARREADTRLASLFNGSHARLADRGPLVVSAP
ncbi:UrcA family protein [Sphingopyxis sp. JAI128]|uniref:UrcA family protein n=1 Tax=Sphingopyxis sp. JAI128 TaxID=2723066 RepID=UPI00161834D6|nr:UrcA family protein [Sphingopyxis sp. JAI128]MBB6424831.1 UrcA family protein [Sphingopyxis sp. JAI128]